MNTQNLTNWSRFIGSVERTFPFWVVSLIWYGMIILLLFWFVDFNNRAPKIFGEDWFSRDPMAFTGFLTVILGILYSVAVDKNQRRLIDRWHNSMVFVSDDVTKDRISTGVISTSFVLQIVITAITVIAMITGYSQFFGNVDYFDEFWLASLICAVLIGLRMGRVASHGFIGNSIEKHENAIRIAVFHPDRTGGLGQIGNFYFLQASVILVPIIWLLVWVLIIPSMADNPDWQDYTKWVDHFYRLLMICFAVFLLAFFLPMLSFRRMIRNWKKENLHGQLKRVHGELIGIRGDPVLQFKKREIDKDLTTFLYNLNHLPDFPVSPITKSVFMTTFFLPLIVNISTYLLSFLN